MSPMANTGPFPPTDAREFTESRWQRAILKSPAAKTEIARNDDSPALRHPHDRGRSESAPSAPSSRDTVEISAQAWRLSRPAEKTGAAPRLDKIAQVRAQIQAGDYDTPERLDVALERMMGREFAEFYY